MVKLVPNSTMRYLIALLLMIGFAIWIKNIQIKTSWQNAGIINFSFGFVLLTAYVTAQILKTIKLPLISVYIFVGIVSGPFITGFLSKDMVDQFSLIDDIALSFIALTAGGELRLSYLKKRMKAISLNILMITIVVFIFILGFIIVGYKWFSFTEKIHFSYVVGLAILLGVISVARSPSSTIAIIQECRATGPFTETVLGVTIATDVLIIIFFTIAMTVVKVLVDVGQTLNFQIFLVLSFEFAISITIGIVLAKSISFYIERVGHDLPFFLLFIGFGITKTSGWLSHFINTHYNIHLYLEPLLICMSTGFVVQNFSKTGPRFLESLEKISLPIYILFFSIAGASLDLGALIECWPLAISLVAVRIIGFICGTWSAGILAKEPPLFIKYAWMAYLTQAGVAIGLAKLAEVQFPEIGKYMTTIVLAVISINQIVGPITFKYSLFKVGEAQKS